MDGKKASGGGDGDSFVFEAMSKDELVEVGLWERRIDEDRDTAADLFFRALIRAANAGYKLQDEADRPPAARSFEPRQQPPPNKLGSPPPQPPPPETEFRRITVLALCAPAPPKNRTRKPPAARAPQVKRPRCASIAPRGGAGKKGPELDHPHGRSLVSLVQPRHPSTTSKPDQAPARPQNPTETVTAPCAPPHPAREPEWAPSSSTAGFPQGKIGTS